MSELVTFGETMLRLSPPVHQRLETAETLEIRAAGAESNVAVAASRLGAEATWISKLPNSPLGRRVTGELHQHGIETEIVWSDEHRQGTYYLEFAGAPRGVNVIYDRKRAAVTTATPEELPVRMVEEARVFYTCGITPALSDQLRHTTRELLQRAGEAGTRTAFDVNYRSKLWSPEEARGTLEPLLSMVDVLVCGLDDAREVLDREGRPEEIVESLATAHRIDTVILTLGEEGALAFRDDRMHRQPIFEADTYDPIGTGDAFVGAYLARRVDGDDVPTALQYGAATAALKRTMPGDMVSLTRREVEQVIEHGSEDISR